MNWFRFYHDALDDPKVQRLEPALFKAWVNLLCLASKSDERGCLPSIEDIAFSLRVSDDEAAHIVEELTRRGLIDGDECEREIHNWHGRQLIKPSDQPERVAERVRKHRERERNATVTPNVTPLDKIRVDTDIEKSREEETLSALSRDKKRATAFPEHFEPPYAWAADELGMTTAVVDRHVRCMRDWALSKGESRKDWQAFARNWLRKAKDEPARASPNGNGDSALAYFRSESEKRVST